MRSLCVLALAALVAPCCLTADADPAAELRAHVTREAQARALPPVPVRYASDKPVLSKIVSADEQGFLMNTQGLEVKVTWQKLGDDGLLQLFRPLVADSPGPVHAAYLRLALKLGQGESAAFDSLLNALWEKDREAAKSVDAARPAAAHATKPKDHPRNQPKADATGSAPAKPPSSALAAAGLAGIPAQAAAKEGPKGNNPFFDDGGVLWWETNCERALARAAAEGKGVFLFMTRHHCPNSYTVAECVLAEPEFRDWISESFVPLAVSVDVVNLKDLERRAGRPRLKGAEAKDNELRFGLKERICAEVAKKSPAVPPPLMAILTPNGDVAAAEAGLVTPEAFREFLGKASKRPARMATPRPRPQPAAPLPIFAPYEYVRVDLGGGQFVFKGHGSGGEGPNVTTLQSIPDPYEMAGRKFGVGGFVCIYAANAAQEIGQIYLSAGSNAHGAHWMTFTNPPMRCVWENSGEGIMFYQPHIPPAVEALDYRVHENCYSVLVSPTAGCLSVLGCPPAHRHYNGTVRVGQRPLGVKMTHGEKKHWYAFTCCAGDGTIAAVFLDAVDGEKAGNRIGETTYFDAANGKQLDFRPASEQVIDTEGRGGGQKGFGKIPGRPGPASQIGQTLKLEDLTILQSRNWSDAAAADDTKKAYLFVSCAGRNAIGVFDIAPFLKGAGKDLVMLGVHENIPNPKKLLLSGDHLYVGNNPGATVTKISLAKLPSLQPAKMEVIPVGKDPMGMAVGPEFGIGGILFVCNRGSDSVSMVRGNKELGRLDATNSAPLKEPYGIWISGCSTRMIVSNYADEYATWWNFRLFPTGQVKDPKDVLISSDRLWTGAGVTAIDGDYGP